MLAPRYKRKLWIEESQRVEKENDGAILPLSSGEKSAKRQLASFLSVEVEGNDL